MKVAKHFLRVRHDIINSWGHQLLKVISRTVRWRMHIPFKLAHIISQLSKTMLPCFMELASIDMTSIFSFLCGWCHFHGNLVNMQGILWDFYDVFSLPLGLEFIRCSTLNLLFTYIDLLVSSIMLKITSWKVMIDKFKSRGTNWIVKLLSSGGCLTVIKSFLSISIETCFMNLFHAPKNIINQLDSTQNNFFMGSKFLRT